MIDPITGEITMIENLIQANNERIERLQDEMINVMNRLYQIETNAKSINTIRKINSIKLIQMKDKKAAKKIIKIAKSDKKLYSKADVIYAKLIRKRIKNEERLTKDKSE